VVPDAISIQADRHHLRLEDSSLDLVISVEGLSGAITLFPEIHRVLTADGIFLFTDIVYDSQPATEKSATSNANTLAEYKTNIEKAGFADIHLYDSTAFSSTKILDTLHLEFRTKIVAQNLSMQLFDSVISRLPWANRPISLYIVGIARKGQPSSIL